MSKTDFNTILLVDQTPKEVFSAINDVRGWWSEEVEGKTAQLGDIFRYHYKDVHVCQIKLVEVIPDQKVVWHIVENYFSFTQDKSEWKDTKIIFEISKTGEKTKLKFTHLGLVPEYECYAICQEAWSNYINNSLKDLITKGKGEPNPKEGGFNAKIIDKWQLK